MFEQLQPKEALTLKRALIVDDEYLCRELMQDILGLIGVQAEAAHNGAEALGMISRTDYDLVLMDNHMPVMDGISTIKRIREDKTPVDLPIIMVTGKASRALFRECIQAGVNGFMPKPYTPGELLGVIDRVMRGEMLSERSAVSDRLVQS